MEGQQRGKNLNRDGTSSGSRLEEGSHVDPELINGARSKDFHKLNIQATEDWRKETCGGFTQQHCGNIVSVKSWERNVAVMLLCESTMSLLKHRTHNSVQQRLMSKIFHIF